MLISKVNNDKEINIKPRNNSIWQINMVYYVRSIITNRNRATADIKIGNSAIGKLGFPEKYNTLGNRLF